MNKNKQSENVSRLNYFIEEGVIISSAGQNQIIGGGLPSWIEPLVDRLIDMYG